MPILKPINILQLLLILVLLCALSGCISKAIAEAMGESFGEIIKIQMVLAMPVTINPQIFYCQNNRWPQSTEELNCFCSDPNNNCLPLLDKRITAEFYELPDKTLHVKCSLPNPLNASDPCGGFAFSTTLKTPDPNNCLRLKEMKWHYYRIIRDCLDPNAPKRKKSGSTEDNSEGGMGDSHLF